MGFPESFVGTGVLDCPFRIPPKEGDKKHICPRRGGVSPPAFLWRKSPSNSCGGNAEYEQNVNKVESSEKFGNKG